MKSYQFRFLDKFDFVVVMRVETVPDDLDALAEAEKLSLTHTIEVWDGVRKVARVKKGNVPPVSMDRLGG
ncbi:MAG: hypothetical protein J0I19_12405 [Alphaproteobacteria bacterium]|nr:hypothetical protein [Alphaproteobacteria bacterium]